MIRVALLVLLVGCAAARIRPDGTVEAVAFGQAHVNTSSATGAFLGQRRELVVAGGALSSPGEAAFASVVALVATLATGVFL